MKQSNLFREKQDVLRNEMICYIRNILLVNADRRDMADDQYLLSIGYSIDCDECIDDLESLYLSDSTVLANLSYADAVELKYFHESSLIDIIDYLERHNLSSVSH